MNRRNRRRESRSRTRAVAAAMIMITGASSSRAKDRDTPNAARLYWGSARRAIRAARNGPSTAIISQVAARGSQKRNTRPVPKGARGSTAAAGTAGESFPAGGNRRGGRRGSAFHCGPAPAAAQAAVGAVMGSGPVAEKWGREGDLPSPGEVEERCAKPRPWRRRRTTR